MSSKGRDQNRSERAAAIQRDQQRKERTKRTAISVAVVVVVAVVIGAAFWATRGGGGSAVAADGGSLKVVRDGTAMVVGDPDAKVKVTVYEDFLCPFCREFETSSRDFLHADAAQGTVLVTYRPFHLLPEDYSTQALEAWGQVLTHGTGRQALRFHDLLYDNQPYENASSFPSTADLRALAGKAGVSGSVQQQIGAGGTSFFDGAQQAASGIDSTPTVLVNGQRFGQGQSVAQLVSALEKKIAADG